jgi:hypothetical protein
MSASKHLILSSWPMSFVFMDPITEPSFNSKCRPLTCG